MGLFKPDFYRFFLVGFAVGALFVVGAMDTQVGPAIKDGVVPAAEAQAAR